MSVKRIKASGQSSTNLRGGNSADSLETEKQQLKDEIHKLQTLVSRVEATLDISKFGNVVKTPNLLPLSLDRRASRKLPNPTVLLRKEIQKFTGFCCTKANKTEYIFNYKPYPATGSKEIFWVQICNKDGKGILGKWVAPPITIDINRILSETPLDTLSMVVPFLKNWKLHIDCYIERKLQFCKLKDFISEASNCTLDAIASFTRMTIQLVGVHHKQKDTYINVTIYLLYKPHETRASKIKTEWSLKKCSSKEESELKAYTKCLKKNTLLEGFRLMLDTTHPLFSWSTEKNDDSPLELNNSSDSDEDSILERVKRDKDIQKRRKRRRSKERSKRMRGKKSSAKSQLRVDENEERNKLETSKLSSLLRESNRSKTKLTSTVDDSAKKPRRELRQTTINFRSNKTSTASIENSTVAEVHEVPDSNPEMSSRANSRKPDDKTGRKAAVAKKQIRPAGILSAKKKGTRKMSSAITSTPLGNRTASKVQFVGISNVEISPIASEDEKDDEI